MKFTAQVGDLLAGVDLASKAASTKRTVAVLGCVRLSVSGKWMEIAASDMECTIITQVAVLKGTKGVAVINAKVLRETLKTFPKNDLIDVVFDAKSGTVEIACGTSKMTLDTLPADDFPTLPEPPTGQFPVRTAAFKQTFEMVRRSASKDESRPVLTGVLVTVKDGILSLAATDSYRLAMTEAEIDTIGQVFEEKIPAKSLTILSRMIAKYDSFLMGGSLTMGTTDGNWIGFTFGTTQLLTRRIDGQFPDVSRLLPEAYEGYVTFDRERTIPIIRRIEKMGERNSPLRLKVHPDGTVTASLRVFDRGEITEQIDATVTGLKRAKDKVFPEFEAGFNSGFFAEGLESLTDDKVTVAVINPLRPALMYGGEPLVGAKPATAYLIMPIRLAG
jgi:DNA polymerase-3 subunit beta